MKNRTRRRPLVLWLLLALLLLMGAASVISGGMLVASPDGSLMQMPLSMLEHSPFSDFLVPGLILVLVLGVYCLVVAYCLWALPGWRWPWALNPFRDTHWAWAGSLVAGSAVVIWIVTEMIMLRAAAFLHWLALGWGMLLIGLTLLPTVHREYRSPS